MLGESPLNISISIVCFNSSDLELRALISSLISSVRSLRNTYAVSKLPVFLIDNSQRQELSLDIFGDFADQLVVQEIDLCLIQGHGNIGYGRGHNSVLGNLESKYHLILNPDVQLDEDCLHHGIAYLEENKDVVLTSPSALCENDSKQYLCKRYPAVLTFLVRGFFPRSWRLPFRDRLERYEMHELSESEPSTSIPIVSGCFMLCRTDTLKSIGGFDENYFLYFEDFDLSLRMGKIGELAYVPAMRIQHTGGHAARKGFAHLRMFIMSGFRFFNTHGWRFFRQAG